MLVQQGEQVFALAVMILTNHVLTRLNKVAAIKIMQPRWWLRPKHWWLWWPKGGFGNGGNSHKGGGFA